MKIVSVESGSKGNATLVIDEGRVLLIDMGVTLTALTESLRRHNLNIYNIDALLLTHEHSDHTKGICYLPPLPIYTMEGTYEGDNVVTINKYQKFNVKNFEITPLKTSHDVKNPCGFLINSKNETLCYLTDSGIVPKRTLNKIKNVNYYFFESNHDVQMLINTNRPYFLKKRILSDKGHLSNEQSANYLKDLIGPDTKEIILAHLSEEANDPQVALKTHKTIYKNNDINMKKIKLHCANQHVEVEGGH